MKNDFPPRPTHKREIESLLEVFSSVTEEHQAVYLSAPITTGKRYSEWFRRFNGRPEHSGADYEDAHVREVIEPNRERARSVAQELRCALPGVLIDPTAMGDLPAWTQCDYRHFWASVIERYARAVVFVNGWQYSSGCAYEFLTAQRSGVETLSEANTPLTLEAGERLLRTAIAEMRAERLPTDFLEAVMEEMIRLHSRSAP